LFAIEAPSSRALLADVSFSLRVPIRLAPGRSVAGIGRESFSIDGKLYRFSEEDPYLAILVDNFSCEEAAQNHFDRLLAALYWVAIDRGVAFTAGRHFDKIAFASDPVLAAKNLNKAFWLELKRCDGIANGNMPCVYSTEAQLRFMTVGDATIHIGTLPSQFVDSLTSGLLGCDAGALSDKRTKTALELYCAHYHEVSRPARFIALVMAMEVLTRKTEKARIVLDLMEKWIDETDIVQQGDRSADEREALESIKSELLFRKDASLRTRVRRLAAGTPDLSEADVARAVRIYDTRSLLVHEGAVPERVIDDAIHDGQRIIGIMLRHRLRGGP